MQRPPLRCVFVTISPMLSAIIAEAFSRRLGFELTAELASRDGLAASLPLLGPDLVVIGLHPGEADQVTGTELLASVPKAKILLITDAGDHAYLHELRPHRTVLFDFSPDKLLSAIVGVG